jgi:hypothetical protein
MKRLVVPHLLLGVVLGVALLVVLAACSKPDPELVVVLQGWRNADYAHQVCERTRTWHRQNRDLIAQVGCQSVTVCPEMMPLVTRCAMDPMSDLRDFEDDFLAQAAASPRCKGVRIVRINERENLDKAVADILERPHWQLFLDFQPGEPKQHWRMTDRDSRAIFPKGEGNPKEIASDICAIVTERGAKLFN